MIKHIAKPHIFDEILEVIAHSKEQGLPLESIELDVFEWTTLIQSEQVSWLAPASHIDAKRDREMKLAGIRVWSPKPRSIQRSRGILR